MRLYRTVFPAIAQQGQSYSGAGAAKSPGRWNALGQPVIYCSTSLEAVAAERAFYALVQPTEAYIAERSLRSNFPKSLYDDVVDVQYTLVEADFADEHLLVDLTNVTEFQKQLGIAKIPSKALVDARKSFYQLDPWTRQLASSIESTGAHGIKVPSARSNNGYNVVLFESNINQKSCILQPGIDFVLSAVEVSSLKKLKMKQFAEDKKFLYETKGTSGVADVLFF